MPIGTCPLEYRKQNYLAMKTPYYCLKLPLWYPLNVYRDVQLYTSDYLSCHICLTIDLVLLNQIVCEHVELCQN